MTLAHGTVEAYRPGSRSLRSSSRLTEAPVKIRSSSGLHQYGCKNRRRRTWLRMSSRSGSMRRIPAICVRYSRIHPLYDGVLIVSNKTSVRRKSTRRDVSSRIPRSRRPSAYRDPAGGPGRYQSSSRKRPQFAARRQRRPCYKRRERARGSAFASASTSLATVPGLVRSSTIELTGPNPSRTGRFAPTTANSRTEPPTPESNRYSSAVPRSIPVRSGSDSGGWPATSGSATVRRYRTVRSLSATIDGGFSAENRIHISTYV